MFHVLFGLPALYVVSRWLWPLSLPLPASIVLALAVLLASQYHLLCRISSGSPFAPEMPRRWVIALNWAFAAVVLLALFQIVIDIAALLPMLVARQNLPIPDGLRYAIAAAAMALSALGVRQAILVPSLKDVMVEITGLPTQFEGYTLLQLTDLHISRLFDRAWTDAVVNASNRLGVDLIVITGDVADGSVELRREAAAPLAKLSAPDGVHVISGNHEYFFDYRDWMVLFATLGFRSLENGHTLLERHGSCLVLAGVTDLSAPETGLPGPDLSKALAGAPPNVPVILLDHQPRNAHLAAARGVALQLSGHTHGGMVSGLARLVALANKGFVSGSYAVRDMHLYVSNGTALWPGFALRLGKAAELTRITLKQRQV
jgi:predicted MPP superfamily phosphohydrolase